MPPTKLKVRPYRHAATSKFVVTWSTGSRPTAVQVVAWETLNSTAAPADRARYVAGDWKRNRRFFVSKEEAQRFANGQKTKLSTEGQRGLHLPDEFRGTPNEEEQKPVRPGWR